MTLVCQPHTPASFDYCSRECALHGLFAKQNCSHELCSCAEHCMGTDDVCTGSGASKDPTHKSLPAVLDAKPGGTTLRLNGRPPMHYVPGQMYELSVLANVTGNDTWFLVDSGVGEIRRLSHATDETGNAVEQRVGSWRSQCNGSRASFVSVGGTPTSMHWIAPRAAAGPVVLRVATATSMGDIGINAAILNASSTGQLPAATAGYACTTSGTSSHVPWPLRQCQIVPPGTVGATNLTSCEADCFRGTRHDVYRCTRCAHVYDPERDGNGMAFEDLPDSWTCPTCGAPKSAYAKQIGADAVVRWAHPDM